MGHKGTANKTMQVRVCVCVCVQGAAGGGGRELQLGVGVFFPLFHFFCFFNFSKEERTPQSQVPRHPPSPHPSPPQPRIPLHALGRGQGVVTQPPLLTLWTPQNSSPTHTPLFLLEPFGSSFSFPPYFFFFSSPVLSTKVLSQS